MNIQLVRMFRIPPQMDSGSNFLSILRVLYLLEKRGGTPGPIPLRERRRDFSPRQINNEGLRIRRSWHERILQRFFYIEEEIASCTPLGVERSTSYQEAVGSPNYEG